MIVYYRNVSLPCFSFFFSFFSQARRRGIARQETYSHFHLQLGKVHTLFRHRYIVVFSFFLREKFEPSAGRRFDKLRYAERQRTHEIVPRRPIPIPNFDQKSSVFVLRFQIAKNRIDRSLATFLLLFECNTYIFFASRLKAISLEIVSNFTVTYKMIVSFHSGFNEDLIVFVFFFTLSESGINFSLT